MRVLFFTNYFMNVTDMSKVRVTATVFGFILVIGWANFVAAQTSFWLTDGSVAASVSPSVATIEALVGEPKDILLWTRPDATLQNFSLNIVSNSETVLEFDSVDVHNDSGDGTNRFEFVFDSANGLEVESGFCDFEGVDFDNLPEHAIFDIRGFTINDDNAEGIPASEEGVLLATITLTALTLGEADLFLQIGEIGISNVEQTTFQSNVHFGSESDALLNAEVNRCVNSANSEATVSVVEALSRVVLRGDFNDDGNIDDQDIDLLSAEVRAGTNGALYDLTGDGLADTNDRVEWVEEIKDTIFGDADFDKDVDFVDFLALSNRFGNPGGWTQGDFDGTGDINFPDFLVLSAAFGTTATAEAVPEPGTNLLCCFVGLLLLPFRAVRACKDRRIGRRLFAD